jgi:hypothetical protein
MDRITASILDGFKVERGLESLPRSELFESFAGYCVLSQAVARPFSHSWPERAS